MKGALIQIQKWHLLAQIIIKSYTSNMTLRAMKKLKFNNLNLLNSV